MRNSFTIRKLITSIVVTGLLLYFMIQTTSPKIIFVPFLICSCAMVGKCIAQMLEHEKMTDFFGKLFTLGFLLFLIGFLVVACYVSIRDKNYSILIFTIPFWIVALFLLKKRILGGRGNTDGESVISFRIVISVMLVLLALITGVLLLIFGFKRMDATIIFGGAFFALGSFTFVLTALVIKGYFDKCKIDVLGLYMGILIALFGVGIGYFMLQKQVLNLWILIPLLMVIVGIYQVVRCIRNRESKGE